MPIDERIKKSWIELQARSDVTVNAIGVKIKPKDVWKEEGTDRFLRK